MKRVLASAGMILFGLIVVIPLVWVVICSLKASPEIFSNPWGLPKALKFENFANAWTKEGIGGYFFNSLVVTVATLVFLLPAGAMAAYVLARFPFRGSKTIFGGFLGGMMFPHFLVIVPLFLLLESMHMLDTRQGLIVVYVAYSLSFTVFVLTGFFQSLPEELGEAAMIDGCGHTGTFWHVMLPLARPGILVVAIFNSIGLWNEYGLALVLLPSPEKRTLPLGIADMVMSRQYESDWGTLFAGLVIVMLPMLTVYWIFKERIHETMLAGAVKG